MDNHEYNINHEVNKYLQEKKEYEAAQDYAIRAIGLLATALLGLLYATTHMS